MELVSFMATDRTVFPRLGDSEIVVAIRGVSAMVLMSKGICLMADRMASLRRGVCNMVEPESLMGLKALVGDCRTELKGEKGAAVIELAWIVTSFVVGAASGGV
jgi:hypothetical protein